MRLHKRTQDTYTPSSRLISARFDRTQAISTGVDSGRCLTPVLCWIIDDYIGVSRDRDRGLLTLTAWNFSLSRNLGTRFCLVYGVARTTIGGELILTLSRAPSKLTILKSFVRLENSCKKVSGHRTNICVSRNIIGDFIRLRKRSDIQKLSVRNSFRYPKFTSIVTFVRRSELSCAANPNDCKTSNTITTYLYFRSIIPYSNSIDSWKNIFSRFDIRARRVCTPETCLFSE